MSENMSAEQVAVMLKIADKIRKGEPVGIIVARDVGKESMIRILQKLAGKYVDDGDGVRASIALREAKKLVDEGASRKEAEDERGPHVR